MPAFAFKGLDGRGKAVAGVRDAESPRTLRSQLRREGVFVTELREARERAGSGKGLSKEVDFKSFFDRVRPQDVAALTRQLSTLLRAGIPLAEALGALVEQSSSEKLRRSLSELRTRVNEGSALGDALAAQPKIFTELYVNMVRAGEAAGNLEQVLTRLAQFMDGQVRLRNKIQSAMMYPIVMAAVSMLITGLLMVVVVPKITQIFDDMGKSLPWNTQLLIGISRITGDYWWLIIILMGGAIYGFVRWKRSPKGKAVWDRFVLKIWVVGPLVRMVAIGRFARTLGTMLASGVPLLQTLEIVKSILGNEVLIGVVEDARKAIREGESIADPLAKSGHFPPVVTRMIAVGERSGQLETMLENVADAYEADVELKINRLTGLLEPVMIIVMGGLVGFIVFSILMPILDMNEMVG
ncbi:MAG: type II secretion system inner membrane protein GspF [Deltaproteobacteria bacterium]|nr:type II secretion system inner membrane protein GspF [Deltaproteobacteria bacterium]